MSTVPTFTGRVLEGGLLVLDRPKDYGRWLKSLAGRCVSLTLMVKRERRSNAQLRWLFGIAYERLLEHYGYDLHERKIAKLNLHYELLRRCFGTHWDARLKAEVPNVPASRELDTKIAADYQDWIVRYAAEDGCVIPLPNEVDLSKVDAWEAA